MFEDYGTRDVSNDHYVVNESRRAYAFIVPADAEVTVLTGAIQPTRITVSELARIVDGTSDLQLFEPIATGFWIRGGNDTITSLDQQYVP
jgi:hypothetical protein